MNDDMNTTTNSSSSSRVSLDDMRLAMVKFKALEKENLRRSAQMIERMKCDVCGRKPTVIRDGSGETVVVCRHTWEALQRFLKVTRSLALESLCLPSLLSGLEIELFDDGPVRW